AAPRLPAERHFADRRAMFEEPFKQGFMFGWIDIAQTAREDRDRSGFDRRLMGPRVDPAREAGNDHMPGSCNSASKLRREGETGGRCVAGADNRDFRAFEARKIAADSDHGRRRSGAPQKGWILRLANPDKTRPRLVRRLALPLDFLDGRDADRPASLAARDQGRQCRERRASAPMPAQQDLKSPGSDIFTAQEPQPVEALAVVEGG